jgi:hypothetical protein
MPTEDAMTKLTLVALGSALFVIECVIIFFIGIALHFGYLMPRQAGSGRGAHPRAGVRHDGAWSAVRQRG